MYGVSLTSSHLFIIYLFQNIQCPSHCCDVFSKVSSPPSLIVISLPDDSTHARNRKDGSPKWLNKCPAISHCTSPPPHFHNYCTGQLRALDHCQAHSCKCTHTTRLSSSNPFKFTSLSYAEAYLHSYSLWDE